MLRQAGISVLIASLAHKTSDYRALVDQVRGRCPELRETVYIGDPSWDALTAGSASVPHGQPAAIADPDRATWEALDAGRDPTADPDPARPGRSDGGAPSDPV